MRYLFSLLRPFLCVMLFASLPLAQAQQPDAGVEAVAGDESSSAVSEPAAETVIAAATPEPETPVTESLAAVADDSVAARRDDSAPAPQEPGTPASDADTPTGGEASAEAETESPADDTPRPPQADNIDLKEVVVELETPVHQPKPEPAPAPTATVKVILGVEVPPGTSTRLIWTPDDVASGFAERTPVLVVNGRNPGKTLCLTGAVHGDELNGIEMIRRIMYQLEPDKVSGTVIGVPVVNLMGFRRSTRYLPDRRDLNRYFPGNTYGSSASRIAHSFFTNIISHCEALVDIHTGSFHRTNLTQLRADLSSEAVASLAQSFGNIAVLNSRGNPGSLRASAVRAGIPTVTVEAGEPLRLQSDVVAEGTRAIETLLSKMGIYGRPSKWSRQAPVYYRSSWVRSDQSGILFSRVPLGKRVARGEVLGTVTDPITNARSDIVSPYHGRVLGMALDQVVLPGFAAYHIGIQTPEAMLIEEAQMQEEQMLDEEDADAPPLPVPPGYETVPEQLPQTKSGEVTHDEEEEEEGEEED